MNSFEGYFPSQASQLTGSLLTQVKALKFAEFLFFFITMVTSRSFKPNSCVYVSGGARGEGRCARVSLPGAAGTASPHTAATATEAAATTAATTAGAAAAVRR